MSEREALAASVAAGREVEWDETASQSKAVSELVCRELRAVETIGRDGEPRPGLLGADQSALGDST